MSLKMAPSILAADFARLGEEVHRVEAAGADQIHIDVMDGHFVPNLSMGPIVVSALKRASRLPLDVHLMIEDPTRYVPSFVDAGADHISFHLECFLDDPDGASKLLRWLAERGVGRGLAINPSTPVESVLGWIEQLDLVLIMTVEPGFGGQGFLPENLAKVERVRELSRASPRAAALDVQVDGGVGATTIASCASAGANVFVAGSAIFGADDSGAALRSLRALAASGAASSGIKASPGGLGGSRGTGSPPRQD